MSGRATSDARQAGGKAIVGILERLLRVGEKKTLRQLHSIANQVNAIEDHYTDLTDAELRALTDEFRARYADGASLDELLPEAFATVREAAIRTLGQRHYDVQIMGGAALHLGNIAEMRTGEGKTLVATLPSYLNALSGEGVHVVTVNDYLAERDAEWTGRVHRFLGLEVGSILSGMPAPARRQSYAADITYGTNNEFGFDYLRDNMAWSQAERVQRGHHFAIVDEVDSILVDEARTPLIISGPTDIQTHWYAEFAKLVDKMVLNAAYEIDEKKKTVSVGEGAIEHVEDQLGISNLYDPEHSSLVSYLANAVRAKELFKRDRDYIVTPDDQVVIVDEHTGRTMAGRRFSNGLHQALEAKERVEVKTENQTLATITLQNYFRLYDKLSGMTGTAMTEAAEFSQIYSLGVVPIPPNRPVQRADEADVVYRTEQAKFDAVVEDIVETHRSGQPILVGTTSVAKSEYLSSLLKKRGIKHAVLNAKYHGQEAGIVAMAGRRGAVTVATNMAGRGTDIMLGGNSEFLAAAALERQGITSAEAPDEYEEAWPEALRQAQETVAAEHDAVTEAGGLYVLGTERHESRRIDNQLRGRSGRQGDPGQSRFYLSLEDDLMRLFKADLVDSFLRRFNVPDDQPIEAKMVSNAIASAQAQREAQNFEVRKDVLKYDDVLNRQRTVIYQERKKVLEGEDIGDQVRTFLSETVAAYVTAETAEGYPEDWNLEQLWTALGQLYPVGVTLEEVIEAEGGDVQDISQGGLIEILQQDAQRAYDERTAELGEQGIGELERRVVLSVLDRKWREHLLEMDYLRNGIGLRAMAQRDPLVEYQREGFQLFGGMMDAIKEDVARLVFSVQVKPPPSALTDASGTVAAGRVAGAVAAAAASPQPEEEAPAEAPAGEPAAVPVAASESDLAAEERDVELELAGLGPRRPERLQYTSPTETGGVASVTDVEAEGPVEVDPNASRAERRRAERANRKRKKR
jgi:preprotein translocase subunit SecA